MAAIDLSSGKTILSTGLLQLENGVAMSTTLTSVTDQSNTASQLKLSTTLTQVAGTLQIHTDTATYIDAEDGSGNNRFTISRDPASQQVNVDFASKPTDLTTSVGAIRTYQDGTNLRESMTFLENGWINSYGGRFNIKSLAGDYGGWFTTNATQSLQITNNVYNNGTASAMNLNSGGLRIEENTSNNAAGGRLHIIGKGSTSATTSLLVQNSSGQTKFFVDDSSVGANCCIGNLINGYSSLQWNANSVGFGLISGGGLGAKLNNNASFVVSDSSSPTNDTSAKLIVNSTSAGFLPPRMTDAQRAAIASPAEGLILFNTDNKGVAYRDGTNWGYLSGAKQTATGSGGTLAISFASGNIVDLTLTGSTTLTFAGHVVGTYIIQVTQGGTGSYTLTYPASVKWSGGTAPTLTTTVGKTDILTFYHDGTSFFGTYSLNY